MLEVTDLRVCYGKAEAVRDISFGVADGEIVGILGPNGAGKTTTLLAISGLLKGFAGRIAFCGEDLSSVKPHEIAKRGLIHAPEGRRLFLGLSVEENLRLGAYTRAGSLRPALGEVYDLFPRLFERRRQTSGTLSGGEQQMVNIGRALMASPRLLILDEPSWGLAPLVVKEIGRAIREISRRRRISILLVEQNARLALACSQRAYVMENGRFVVSGPSDALKADKHVIEVYVGGSV